MSGSSSGVALVERPRRSRLLSLPLVADLGAMVRFFRDGHASLAGKVFVVLAIAYIVCPVDAIPDVAPVLGWLDDIGVGALVIAYLARVLGRYKEADIVVQAEPVPNAVSSH